jgi:prepilin-type N-terminal cleavage/methylation domain-containing protein
MSNATLAPTTATATRPCRATRAARAGLSLVEVLIALAITAMLLTAVAAAYSASAKAIEVNDQFFRASQAARVSVNRITSELRRCQSGATIGTSALEITTTTGEKRTYAHDAANKRLTLTLGVAPYQTTVQVASNVESATFFTDGDSVGLNVVVSVGSNKIVLSGSAIPRRQIQYE